MSAGCQGCKIAPCPFRKSYPDILMMQSSQDRNGGNVARALDRSMQGRIFPQRQVRARFIVIRRISGKSSPQVHLAEDHHLIQALAAQWADKAFRTAILPWRPGRDRSVADTHRPHPRCEDMPVGAVVVAHPVRQWLADGGEVSSQPQVRTATSTGRRRTFRAHTGSQTSLSMMR
jgi:hypothetical protein